MIIGSYVVYNMKLSCSNKTFNLIDMHTRNGSLPSMNNPLSKFLPRMLEVASIWCLRGFLWLTCGRESIAAAWNPGTRSFCIIEGIQTYVCLSLGISPSYAICKFGPSTNTSDLGCLPSVVTGFTTLLMTWAPSSATSSSLQCHYK